jgi:hypothetical protein
MTTQVADYSQDRKEVLHGQLNFKEHLTRDFASCWQMITEHGFQTGWKKITGKPQHGNYNPNWKDCLNFVEAGFLNGKHLTEDCPQLPILKDLPVQRDRYKREEFWRHMWDVCKLHEEAIRRFRRAKRSGMIAHLYPHIIKQLTTTAYIIALAKAECGSE